METSMEPWNPIVGCSVRCGLISNQMNSLAAPNMIFDYSRTSRLSDLYTSMQHTVCQLWTWSPLLFAGTLNISNEKLPYVYGKVVFLSHLVSDISSKIMFD